MSKNIATLKSPVALNARSRVILSAPLLALVERAPTKLGLRVFIILFIYLFIMKIVHKVQTKIKNKRKKN